MVLRPIPFIDPNLSKQPSVSLHGLSLKVLTVHVNVLSLFGAKPFPLIKLLTTRVSDMSAVSTTFNVISYDAVWAKRRIEYLHDEEPMRYMLLQNRMKIDNMIIIIFTIVKKDQN